jgi:hypothetical protein
MESLETIIVGSGVESIGIAAFYLCENLTTVEFKGNRINSLLSEAFSHCIKLSQINIPKSVNYIEDSVFKNNTFLESVTLNHPNIYFAKSADQFTGCKNVTVHAFGQTCVDVSNLGVKVERLYPFTYVTGTDHDTYTDDLGRIKVASISNDALYSFPVG